MLVCVSHLEHELQDLFKLQDLFNSARSRAQKNIISGTTPFEGKVCNFVAELLGL